MRILKNLEAVNAIREPLFLTFGFFDGFHVGHHFVLNRLLEYCQKKNARSLVVTFDALPGVSTSPKKHIYPIETKIQLLSKMGIDYCLLLNFDQVRQFDYRKFLDYFFSANVAGLVASDKLCFGYRRKGSPDQVKKYFLEKRSRAYFFSSLKNKTNKNKLDGKTPGKSKNDRTVAEEICSTEIRNLLESGYIYRANCKLRLPFHLVGKVKRGKAWGRKIGFPTINFAYPPDSVEIPSASYITISVIGDEIYPSMSYVGIPIGKKNPIVETYLLNFSKSVYNNKVVVYFIKNLEKNKHIDNLEDLQVLLKCLRRRLEKYLEKKPVFFREKIKWIEEFKVNKGKSSI